MYSSSKIIFHWKWGFQDFSNKGTSALFLMFLAMLPWPCLHTLPGMLQSRPKSIAIDRTSLSSLIDAVKYLCKEFILTCSQWHMEFSWCHNFNLNKMYYKYKFAGQVFWSNSRIIPDHILRHEMGPLYLPLEKHMWNMPFILKRGKNEK